MYGKPPHGAGLISPMSPGGRGKYADQPIVILGGAGATGHFGTFDFTFHHPLSHSFQLFNLLGSPVSPP
jgi:hypothetical protein